MHIKSSLLALLCLGVCAQAARAVVLYPGNAPASSHPANDVVGQWMPGAGDASCVAIAPNYILTAMHPGYGVGATVTLGSSDYTVSQITQIGNADLRVCQITLPGGQPANLTDYAALFSQTPQQDQAVLIGGFGYGAGTLNANGITWDGVYGTERWGVNTIYGTQLGFTGYSTYTSDLLLTQFTGSGSAAIATGDSGGGLFIWDGTQYAVAGINAYVETLGSSTFSPAETNCFINVSTSLSAIEAATNYTAVGAPEPSALALGAIGAAGLLLRRRSRDDAGDCSV